MQFKHPEILYALFLLVIPIIVHLFQLRRFEKVPFTNVKFLKELTIQTRKSSQLKKWLTLLTRLLLLAFIILAFAQPYISASEAYNTKTETVIYLDNSFSMQAQGKNGTLLNGAIQDLITHLDENEEITLFTNNTNYYNTSIKAAKNELIQTDHSPYQISYKAGLLKAQQLFSEDQSSKKNLIYISDFQQIHDISDLPLDSITNYNFVKLTPNIYKNISIDSVFISRATSENYELTVKLVNQGEPIETLPVSLFNNNNLIAKSAVSISDEENTIFSIPLNNAINGKLSINDNNLQYDNSLYFNIDNKEKIKVLSINSTNDLFLKKIYSNDEFDYQALDFSALNYNLIEDQNLIILNELQEIPLSLITALKSFTDNGGYILIIPSIESNLESYNQLFINYNLFNFETKIAQEKMVTGINSDHPLLDNVFEKQIRNFQYPKVNSFYELQNYTTSILSFQDNRPFLTNANQAYAFSAALNADNSNFKNSPLIVPVLYNIGKQSLKVPKLYYTIGESHTIEIPIKLGQDDILTLVKDEDKIIPLQQTYTNKVALQTSDYPNFSGVISVNNKEKTLKNLSFNFNRSESLLNYYDLSSVSNVNVKETIAETINELKSASKVNELWKWFAIFALAFLIIEMLILKFLK